MTEEIIINGVNVAGCYWKCKDGDCAMYYADLSADNNELEFGFNCEDNPDCYYKQLKRLEQEVKELDNEAQDYHNTIMKLNDLVKELRKENEELKRAYDEVSNNSEILHENNCLRISNKKLSEDLDQANISMMAWKEECIKLRKNLEEIREYITNHLAPKKDVVTNKINEVLNG